MKLIIEPMPIPNDKNQKSNMAATEKEITSHMESVRQLQNQLGVSVYRWKYKALSDWSTALATRFPLTNQRIDDIKRLLNEKYPNAFKVFRINEFKGEKLEHRWPLLLNRMSSNESLVHAIWEFVQKLIKENGDNAFKVALGSTCYEAGLKELERSKQTLVTKPRKKKSLVRSLVRSKRWSLPQYFHNSTLPQAKRRSCTLAGYKSPLTPLTPTMMTPCDLQPDLYSTPEMMSRESTTMTTSHLNVSVLSGYTTPRSGDVTFIDSEVSDLDSSDDEGHVRTPQGHHVTSSRGHHVTLLRQLETVRERTWEQGWTEKGSFVEEGGGGKGKKKTFICFGDCFCLPRSKTKVQSVAL